jgi:ribonucleoside-diphosphate reductase alpha chain
MKSYFGITKTKPRFDFSDIRAKGERLITAGGKAPGPEPLKRCLFEIEQILERKENGDKLTSIEVHDIVCFIADCVLAGGIRRAALISLFSVGDDDVKYAKFGPWWEQNAQRGRANNSGVFLRDRVTKNYFKDYWKTIKDSQSGEPGFYFTSDPNYLTNPCAEISLRPYQFCNLTEINTGNLLKLNNQNQEKARQDFFDRARAASFFGTLQAGFTDFHYLRDVWKRNTEKDALIGVGMTGICNGDVLILREKYSDLLTEGAKVVRKENKRVASEIGINKAARTTTVKPSGTTSAVLGTSSGIHAWHSKYYIRNMQTKVGSDLYNYFTENHPELIKVMDLDPTSAVIGIPQEAPSNAILRESESAIDMLERVRMFNIEWVKEGHRRGPNTNNVSATVSIKENEWEEVGDWMWEYRNTYNGLSVLPYDGGTYKDAPFQECTEEQYLKKLKYLDDIDLTKIVEELDNTNLSGEIACAGGACDI